jgi:hypothetical protein
MAATFLDSPVRSNCRYFSMHDIRLSAAEIDRMLPRDIWKFSLPELEKLAEGLLGPSSEGWMRRGDDSALIANHRRGSLASKLNEEFAVLATQVESILVGKARDSALCAAAFFHIRFECIHPLKDGNGRTGRMLLAGQCRWGYGLPIPEILAELEVNRNDYQRIFVASRKVAKAPEIQFELLVDLLARVLGVPPTASAAKLPYSTDPAFPDPKALPTELELAARSAEKARRLYPQNLWRPGLNELEQMAQSLLGFSEEGWLRHPPMLADGRPASASRLAEEFAALGDQIDSLLIRKPADPVGAAAFFHLRFVNIRPFRDGNGRIGRSLLAAQCGQSCNLPVAEVITRLTGRPKEYRKIFLSPTPEVQFELLTNLLSQALGVSSNPRVRRLPFSIAPLFPYPMAPSIGPNA